MPDAAISELAHLVQPRVRRNPFTWALELLDSARISERLAEPKGCILLYIQHLQGTKDQEI